MKKTKLLYVEDEPFLGKIVKESLESRDFEVLMITDGLRVIPALEKFHPDLCILDVMLPNKDGFTLAGEIRVMHPDLPIIFLTAKTQTEDVLKGFAQGGNDYLRKPFSMEELIVRIQNLLQLTNHQQDGKREAMQLGAFTFDPRKFELIHPEETRKLSHRETELLKILTRHTNIPVERKTILKEIWGDDSFFNSRNLDVYIAKLRDYLKADPSVQIITLKGIGYQFVVD